MTDDERFDESLRMAAQDYHRPPDTPREAIWARIEAARRVQPEVRMPRGVERQWWRWVTGIAATLLLGIAIGRFTVRQEPIRTATTTGPSRDTGVAMAVVPEGTAGVRPRAPATETTAVGLHTARAPSRAHERESAVASMPYRVAALQHLGRAEALLTSFRAETRAGRPDTQISGWARELLSTTRLLLDSPAANDARLGRLLADLELVLAQIAQLPAERGAGELELIDHAVEERDVLFRLRATVPTGTVRART